MLMGNPDAVQVALSPCMSPVDEPRAGRFSWGSESLDTANETRGRYIAALRAADNHDLGPLLAFVRS
jgi:hypothetical protein